MSGDGETLAAEVHKAGGSGSIHCLHIGMTHFCRSWADWFLASDWLAAHDAEVGAAALRDAADQVGPALQNEVGGHTSTHSVRRWLRDRADSLTASGELGGER